MESIETWQARLARAGVVLMSVLALLGLCLTFHAGQYKGVTNILAMDYAQVARNLAQGEGFTTKLIRPLSLARNPRIDRHPELTYAPVHPYLASLFMRMMADKGRALALSCGVAYLLCVPVVFFLGWQLFDLRTGILSAVVFATSLANLRQSISGLEVLWLTLWVCLLFLVLHTLSRKQRWRLHLAAVAGLLMALIYLTQYLWIVVLPLVLAFIYLSSDKRTRVQASVLFLAVFALAILPWCIRNVRVAGAPFFTFRWAEAVMATRSNPGNTLYRQFIPEWPTFVGYAFHHPMEIVQKAQGDIEELYPALLTIGGPFVTAFFLVAALVTLGTATFERMRYLWYTMYLVLFVTLVFVAPAERLLMPLGPMAAIIGVGFFFRLMETKVGDLAPRDRMRWLGVGIAVLLLLHGWPTFSAMLRGVGPEEERLARLEGAVREVASLTSGPIVTDVPWLIAWYADRPAIWLPKTTADLRNMQDKLGKLAWMLLTPQIVDEGYDLAERTRSEWGPAWGEGIRGDIEFQGYRVIKRIAQGNWVLFRADPNARRDLPPEVSKEYNAPAQGGASPAPK
jgi:4-amino-4-deoxy-L-arabinose transferase-like glycosyltransferase